MVVVVGVVVVVVGGGVVTASCVPLGVLPTLLYGHHGDSQLGLGSVLGVDGWVGR